jgi:hypothetical protein
MYPLPPAHVTRRALRPREKLGKPRRVPCPSQPAAPNTEVEPTIPIPPSLSLSVGTATRPLARVYPVRALVGGQCGLSRVMVAGTPFH